MQPQKFLQTLQIISVALLFNLVLISYFYKACHTVSCETATPVTVCLRVVIHTNPGQVFKFGSVYRGDVCSLSLCHDPKCWHNVLCY